MSGAPVKKLPASPRVSSPGVPVPDRGSEEVNIGFSDFRAGGSNQFRDPRLRRSAGNDREFSLGNEFHYGGVSPNPRKFRQPNSSPATIASRSMTCPSPRKV